MISSFFFSVNVPRKQENEIKIRHWTVRQWTDLRWAFTQRDVRAPCLPAPLGGTLYSNPYDIKVIFVHTTTLPPGFTKYKRRYHKKVNSKNIASIYPHKKKILYNKWSIRGKLSALRIFLSLSPYNTVRNRLIDNDELNCQKSFPRNEKIYTVTERGILMDMFSWSTKVISDSFFRERRTGFC